MGNTLRLGDIVKIDECEEYFLFYSGTFKDEEFVLVEVNSFLGKRYFKLLGITKGFDGYTLWFSEELLIKIGNIFDKEKKD